MVKKVFILGAGVTGLATAYELLKRGQNVEIIEKSNSIGGLAKTLIWKGKPIDMGPHIYHTPDKEIENYWLTEFAGLFHEREHWAKNLKKGKFYDYPISREFINGLPEKLRKKINDDLSKTDVNAISRANNYYEYIKALAGETLQKLFFIEYPEKLWGISTKKLDANWAPKRIQITEERRAFYQGQWSAVGNKGSGTILNSLKEKILSLGGIIELNENIKYIEKDGKDTITLIKTDKRNINIRPLDLVINTTSCTVFSALMGDKTSLKYRGVILVMLEVTTASVLPKGVDFIYIDDKDICFNRVSDQNSFVKNPSPTETILCCEITYSPSDRYDLMAPEELVETVKQQIAGLGLTTYDKIVDHKVIKLPEVYPMYFTGYQSELSNIRAKLDKIRNLYTLGSLAEFAYADLQILFSKAIDLAQVITDRTFEINRINKTTPRLDFNNIVKIKGNYIGDGNPAFLIAEIGLNHNGNIELAKELIDAAIKAGADAVKLQSYKSKYRVAKSGKTSRYVEKVLGIEETDYEMLKKYELNQEQTIELFDYARERTIIFSAPFDTESASELDELDPDCYKIASFDLVNLPLIRKVATYNKPIIISTGMAYLSEVEEALLEVAKTGNQNVILMQCTSSYPCPPECMNIKAIDTMKAAFNKIPVGLSDHVIGDMVSIAAVARGANIVEKHFTIDKKMEGPDHILSLIPEEFLEMKRRIRIVEAAIGDGIKQPAANEVSSIIRFRKTMYSKHKIIKGSAISSDDIIYTAPAYGIYSKLENVVTGRIAKYDIEPNTPITWDLLSN
ncbi:FAD-dependent oxidoreductase [bacterium]|nr:FAD-dependent oxidoreductase [bacterium]